jgi:hypothetical protein
MWSWVGLSRDTAESRSAPRVTAVTSSSIRDGVQCVLGRALTAPFSLDLPAESEPDDERHSNDGQNDC